MFKSEWHRQVLFSHGTSAARGVCIYLKKDLQYRVQQTFVDVNGRYVIVELEHCDNPQKRVTICNIYVPNNDNANFFMDVIKGTVNMSSDLIIIGDFNLVMNVQIDRVGSMYNNNKSLAVLEEIMNDLSLIDIWRIRNPDEKTYSWMRTRPTYIASRLDYALIAQGLAQSCVNTSYLPGIRTDHRAFYVGIEQIHNERGSGYLKLNNSLLEKIEFVQEMNKVIEDTIQEANNLDAIEKWIYLSKIMTESCKDISKQYACERNIAISQLSEKIIELQHKLDQNLNNEKLNYQIDNMLTRSQQDMEDLLHEKTKGSIFRTKTRWHELGEKNSKFFFSLEKARYSARVCNKLIDSNEQEITEMHQILEMQHEYFKKLYKKEDIDSFDVANTQNIFVPDSIREAHELPFSKQEMLKAISQLKRHKTPGISGLTADFYKVFAIKFGDVLYEAIGEMFNRGILPKQLSIAVINLIPKPKKDNRFLKNLRLISLLNSAYKIIEKMIANHLEETLNYILSSDQKDLEKT